MKWTSRILILAIFIAATVGCAKGQKAEVSKGRSSAKAATATPKGAKKDGTSASAKSGSAKSGSTKSGSTKSGSTKSGTATGKSGSTTAKSAFHPEHPGTLTMADNGRSFDVSRGEVIVVRLDASHSAGFRWGLMEDIGTVIKQDGSPTYAAKATKSGKGGSSGSEQWRFRAVGTGRETVKLEYKRPWESIPDREFRISVTVR